MSIAGRTVAIVQARMTSTRLPGKVALPLAGVPLLQRVLARVQRIVGLDEVVVAAPEGPAHDRVQELARAMGIRCARGSESDVLARTLAAAELANASTVVRITSDCPFVNPGVASAVVAMQRTTGVPYARTAFETGFPLGFDVEAFTIQALREAAQEATDPYEREHVTPFIWRRTERFPHLLLDRRPDLRSLRLVVDAPPDYELASRLYELTPDRESFEIQDLLALFRAHPELRDLNSGVVQNPFVYREGKA